MEALISLDCKKQDLLILTVFGNYYFSFCLSCQLNFLKLSVTFPVEEEYL
jgi:hypothetical protein